MVASKHSETNPKGGKKWGEGRRRFDENKDTFGCRLEKEKQNLSIQEIS
jgi:hypothetical protein